jgi:cell division protease FtsH
MMDRLVHERQYSDETAKVIDDEVEALISESAIRAREVIKANRKKLDELKDALLEKETIGDADVKKIFEGTVMPKSVALY